MMTICGIKVEISRWSVRAGRGRMNDAALAAQSRADEREQADQDDAVALNDAKRTRVFVLDIMHPQRAG